MHNQESVSHRSKSLLIGQTENGQPIKLDAKTRDTGLHIVGLPRSGKTNAVEILVRQEIDQGQGIFFLDPHGHSYKKMVKWCATRGYFGRKKIVLLDPGADDWAFGFNPLNFGDIKQADFSQCVDYVVNASAQVWGGEDTTTTPRLRLYFGAMVYLLAIKKLTLREMMFLLTEGKRDIFRYLIHDIQDESFRPVLEDLVNSKERQFKEEVASTLRRVFEFVKHSRIRNIVGQQSNVINFRQAMDEGWIILCNLSSGSGLTPDSSRLLGTLIINDIFFKARMRPEDSRPFTLYLDECHLYLNKDVERIVNEAGKFGLNLVAIHQNLAQLDEAGLGIKKAILGIPNRIVFRTEFEDAKDLAFRSFVFDLEEPKKSLIKPVAVGQKIIKLKSQSQGNGYSYSEGITENPGSETVVESVSDTVNEDGEISSTTTSTSSSNTTPLGPTTSQSESWSKQKTNSEHEALATDYKKMPGAVHSLDEQAYKATIRLVNQKTGKALVKLLGQTVEENVSIPFAKPGYAREERVLKFVEDVKKSTSFMQRVEIVEEDVKNRHRLLEERARKYHNNFDEPENFEE